VILIEQYKIIVKQLNLMIKILSPTTTEEFLMIEKAIMKKLFKVLQLL